MQNISKTVNKKIIAILIDVCHSPWQLKNRLLLFWYK